METWRFRHPVHGLYEVQLGYDKEFVGRYPDWPETPYADTDFQEVPADAGLRRRFQLWRANPPQRVQILHEGHPVIRLGRVPKGRQSLDPKNLNAFEAPESLTLGAKSLVFRKTWDSQVLSLVFRDEKDIVEFDPPKGSRGERYTHAIQTSRVKCFLYPVLFGLGKAGWAILALLLMPIINRLLAPFLEWLSQFIPDLPEIPKMWIPIPHPPEIWIPMLHLPEWQFPDWHLPEWVIIAMENRKIWFPIVIGLAGGAIALRNHRKSEDFKKRNNSET